MNRYGRPKPTVLLSKTAKDNRTYQVLRANALFCICYEGEIISYKDFSELTEEALPKYRKTAFAHIGGAKVLVNKLNDRFNTDKFQVIKFEFSSGEIVLEDHQEDDSQE